MTRARLALDTNILVYAEGVNDAERQAAANHLLATLASAEVVVTLQTLGELHYVLTRKGGRTRAQAEAALVPWRELYSVASTSAVAFDRAVRAATAHDLQIWDAIILETAAEAGCILLLSEDMKDGFVYRGVTVANPFSETSHPLLASVLESLT